MNNPSQKYPNAKLQPSTGEDWEKEFCRKFFYKETTAKSIEKETWSNTSYLPIPTPELLGFQKKFFRSMLQKEREKIIKRLRTIHRKNMEIGEDYQYAYGALLDEMQQILKDNQ